MTGRESGDPQRPLRRERGREPTFGIALDQFLFGCGLDHHWPEDGGDAFGIRISPGGLEAGALFDGPTLHSRAGLAELELPRAVPEQLAVALVGQTLEALVGHPALAGEAYVIEEVRERALWNWSGVTRDPYDGSGTPRNRALTRPRAIVNAPAAATGSGRWTERPEHLGFRVVGAVTAGQGRLQRTVQRLRDDGLGHGVALAP